MYALIVASRLLTFFVRVPLSSVSCPNGTNRRRRMIPCTLSPCTGSRTFCTRPKSSWRACSTCSEAVPWVCVPSLRGKVAATMTRACWPARVVRRWRKARVCAAKVES